MKGIRKPEHYAIFKRVMDDVPTTMIDFKMLDFSENKKTFSQSFKDIQKDVSFYIVLHYLSHESFDSFKYMIDSFVKFEFYSSRPKFLIICFGDGNVYDDIYARILKYAWLNKFLDFSIIEILDNNSSQLLFHYNPFFEDFSKTIFGEGISLFPLKLNNVNKYPLKLLGCNYAPFMTFTKDTEVYGINVNHLYFPLVVLAAESMNFNIVYIHCKEGKGTLADSLQSAREHFLRHDVNIFLLPSPLTYEIPHSSRLAIEYLTGDFIAIVPILSSPNFMNMAYIGQFIFTIVLIITAVTCSIKIFQIKKIKFNFINIFQVLLGMSAYIVPKKSVERIFFLCVTIIAMSFSTDFYSQFVNMNVIQTTTEFNTYEDIVKSNLVPYINREAYNIVLSNYDDPFVEQIKAKTKFLKNDSYCIEVLKKTRNITCIMYRVRAEFETRKYWNTTEKQIMKIAKPVFNQQLMAYSFEIGSPYISRLNELFRRHFECGLWLTWYNTREVRKTAEFAKSNSRVESENVGLANELISVLTFGYIFAFILCLVEIAVHFVHPFFIGWYNNFRNQFPKPFELIKRKKKR
jgi:hypothetical protein